MELENNQNQEQQQNEAKREVRWNGIILSIFYLFMALFVVFVFILGHFFSLIMNPQHEVQINNWISWFFFTLFILGIFSSVGNETPFKKWSIRFLGFLLPVVLMVILYFIVT